jgi:exodeoxyribonuclease X
VDYFSNVERHTERLNKRYNKYHSRFRTIDLETSANPLGSEVVEIGAVDLHHDDVILVGSDIVRPSCGIVEVGSACHHLTDSQVAGCPTFDELVGRYLDVEGATGVDIFVAHNWKHEGQWLDPYLLGRPVICTYKCALMVFPDAPAHRNQVLRYWLNPKGLNPLLANMTHRALPDAYVTTFLLRELLERAAIEDLIRWTQEPLLLPGVSFGKHRGSAWSDLPLDYLEWIIDKSDLNDDVKYTASHYRSKRRTAPLRAA